jgi:hypothetical protein
MVLVRTTVPVIRQAESCFVPVTNSTSRLLPIDKKDHDTNNLNRTLRARVRFSWRGSLLPEPDFCQISPKIASVFATTFQRHSGFRPEIRLRRILTGFFPHFSASRRTQVSVNGRMFRFSRMGIGQTGRVRHPQQSGLVGFGGLE